jgi:hypothetical protein
LNAKPTICDCQWSNNCLSANQVRWIGQRYSNLIKGLDRPWCFQEAETPRF